MKIEKRPVRKQGGSQISAKISQKAIKRMIHDDEKQNGDKTAFDCIWSEAKRLFCVMRQRRKKATSVVPLVTFVPSLSKYNY